jgi:hypothetical protein
MRGECTPEQKERCPLSQHYSDTHHTKYPASAYRQPVERAFRNLPENLEQMCRYEHNELHANEEPPEKPSIQFMAEAVLRAEVHQSTKVARQITQIMQSRQAVISAFWRDIEELK